MSTQLSYCAALARRLDRDRFLCALFAPSDCREALFTLLAFNQEVARIREAVRDPLLGEIRLQWWRDSIAEIYDSLHNRKDAAGGGHQVLAPLGRAVRLYGLRRSHFEALIDARARDFDNRPPVDEADLVDYATNTSAGLQAMFLQVLGCSPRDCSQSSRAAAEKAAGHVGIGWALTGLLRAVAGHGREGRVMLPARLLEGAGLGSDHIPKRGSAGQLSLVVKAVAKRARGHLGRAREERKSVPRHLHAALFPAILADGYLGNLERAGHDPFDPGLERGRLGRQLRLAISAARGVY